MIGTDIGTYILNYSYFETRPVFLSALDNVRLENAIFDEIKIDGEISDDFDVDDEWNENTKLMAHFKGNLYAGNASLGVENTSNLIIKRREYGERDWFNMFNIPVVDSSSFDFHLIDRYAAADVVYQYAIVPIIDGLEGEYNIGISEETGNDYISCSFEGIIILDKNIEFSSYLDVSLDTQKNQTISQLIPLNSRFPFIIKNSINNYYSGDVSATFSKLTNCKLYEEGNREYRENLLDFLVNENVKVIKYYDGRTFMVDITSSPTDTDNEHPDKHTISFSFTEVGDMLSNKDMYINGFLDITEEWWQ